MRHPFTLVALCAAAVGMVLALIGTVGVFVARHDTAPYAVVVPAPPTTAVRTTTTTTSISASTSTTAASTGTSTSTSTTAVPWPSTTPRTPPPTTTLPPAPPAGTVNRATTIAPVAWMQDLLDLLNAQRTAVGVPPVTYCPALGLAAQLYTNTLATAGLPLSHSVDGTTYGERANAAGYTGWSVVGENLARGQTNVAQVHAAWVASPTHYANLIDPRFTHVGFGFNFTGTPERPGPWWAQEFGTGGLC